MAQGFGVADVALEDFVGEGKAVFIEGHADGHLPAIVALLFVFSMFGLGVFGAYAFKMSVGDVVEDDAAVEAEEVLGLVAQGGFDGFAVFEKLVADAVEAVFGGFAQAHVEEFRQGGALDPVDERPFAEWFDEAVGNHHLGGGNGGGVHAEVLEHRGETQRVPGLHGDELRPELDDLFGLNFVEQDAVDDRAADSLGGPLGAFGEAGDVDDPGGCIFGERDIQQSGVAVDLLFYGLGEAAGIASGQGGIAEGGDHPLARLAFGITISLNELQQRRALDLFGAEKHAGKIGGKIGNQQELNKFVRHYKTTFRVNYQRLMAFFA